MGRLWLCKVINRETNRWWNQLFSAVDKHSMSLNFRFVSGLLKLRTSLFCHVWCNLSSRPEILRLLLSFLLIIISNYCYYYFNFLASPKIALPNPAPDVRAYPRETLSCSATGPLPIYVALVRNATVLANTTNTVGTELYKEGNYSCVATNKYGTDTRVITVTFLGKALFCYFLNYSEGV